MINGKDMLSPYHLAIQKNMRQSPFAIHTPSCKPPTPSVVKKMNMGSGMFSPLLNRFLLSNQVSPAPKKLTHSFTELTNLLFDKKAKPNESLVSSEKIKECIKPSSFKNMAEGALNLSQGLKGSTPGLNREDCVSLSKRKNFFMQKKLGSVQSFEQNFVGSHSKVQTPVRNLFRESTGATGTHESPREVSIERRQRDREQRSQQQKTRLEEKFFSQFKESILDQNESSIFKKKTVLKASPQKANPKSSEKIRNQNVIVNLQKGCDQSLLVCPTPTKKSGSSGRRGESLLAKRGSEQLNNDQSSNKTFSDFFAFDMQNKLKIQFQKEFLRLLKLDLSKDKIVELIQSDYQPMLDLDPRLTHLGKSPAKPRPRLGLPKTPRQLDFGASSVSKSKGIFMEKLCYGSKSKSARVKYLNMLDEAMYKSSREYKKQTNREKKSFRVRRYNFFWHYNPELFDTSSRKKNKRFSFTISNPATEKNALRVYSRNKAPRKNPVYVLDSPEASFTQMNQLHMSSNEIRSERIRNRLMKSSLHAQPELPLDIDFSDDRFIVSEARKPNEKQTPDQTLEYIEYLKQDRMLDESTSNALRAEANTEAQNMKINSGVLNSPREPKTRKKNKFVTPQLFSGTYRDYKDKADIEDQKETAKKQQMCNELCKESPLKLSQGGLDFIRASGIFDPKSPMPSKSVKMFGSFNHIPDNKPYETPRNEFGQHKQLMDNLEHSERGFLDKKEGMNVSKHSNFLETKFQNVKKTSKKYNSKHFKYLGLLQSKSPRPQLKPSMAHETPENGFLHTNPAFLDKQFDFSKINPKDFEDFALNQSSSMIDSSIKNMESANLGEKIKNLNETQFEEDFLRRASGTSKLVEINNLMGQVGANYPRNPINLNPTLVESSGVRELLRKAQDTPSDKRLSERKGCFCKNTECLKNYCSCFKMGLMCLDICECKNCENHEHSQRRQEKMRSIALKSQTSSDRKKDGWNRHKEMREMLNSKINESLKGNPQDLFSLGRSGKKSQNKCKAGVSGLLRDFEMLHREEKNLSKEMQEF